MSQPDTPTYDELTALCAQMAAELGQAQLLADVAETLTGNRSDDDYVAGVKAEIDAALTAYASMEGKINE